MTTSETSGTLGPRTVRRVGYGAMQLGARGPLPSPDQDRAAAVLRLAVELGVDHVDTAQFYGGGSVNALIRRTLAPYDEGLALATKVGAVETADGLVPAQKPAELRAQVEDNLATLGVDRVALVNLRRVDRAPGIVAEGDQVVDLDDQLAELVALRDEGKVEAIGLSHVSREQLEQALPAGPVAVQNMHSLLDRSGEDVLDLCREHGLAWVPYFPLGSGFPGRPKVAEHPVVLEVAAEVGVTGAQVGLAWELAHHEGTLLIPGTSDPDHLRENLAVADVRLTPEQVTRLERVAPADA